MKYPIAVLALGLLLLAPRSVSTAGSPGPTIDAFLSPAYPQELVSAKKTDRIAWWSYERGRRNVFSAAAPDFKPVRLTNFQDDNGVDIDSLQISDDGRIV